MGKRERVGTALPCHKNTLGYLGGWRVVGRCGGAQSFILHAQRTADHRPSFPLLCPFLPWGRCVSSRFAFRRAKCAWHGWLGWLRGGDVATVGGGWLGWLARKARRKPAPPPSSLEREECGGWWTTAMVTRAPGPAPGRTQCASARGRDGACRGGHTGTPHVASPGAPCLALFAPSQQQQLNPLNPFLPTPTHHHRKRSRFPFRQ